MSQNGENRKKKDVDLANVKKQIAKLKEDRDNVDASIKEVESVLEDNENGKDIKSEVREAAIKDYSKLKKRIDRLNKEIEKKQTKLQDLNKKIDGTESILQQKDKNLNKVSDELKEKEEVHDKNSELLSSLVKNVDSLEDRLNEKNQRLQETTKQYEEITANFEELSKLHEDLMKLVSQKKDEEVRLENRLTSGILHVDT